MFWGSHEVFLVGVIDKQNKEQKELQSLQRQKRMVHAQTNLNLIGVQRQKFTDINPNDLVNEILDMTPQVLVSTIEMISQRRVQVKAVAASRSGIQQQTKNLLVTELGLTLVGDYKGMVHLIQNIAKSDKIIRWDNLSFSISEKRYPKGLIYLTLKVTHTP